MIFICLSKFRKKVSKEGLAATNAAMSKLQKDGVKSIGAYYTLGRYDAVFIFEGPEKGAIQKYMKAAMAVSDISATETLVGLKREDAVKLLGL